MHLMQSMDLEFNSITQSDYNGWYRNIKKYVRLSFEEVAILEQLVKIVLFIYNINVIIFYLLYVHY